MVTSHMVQAWWPPVAFVLGHVFTPGQATWGMLHFHTQGLNRELPSVALRIFPWEVAQGLRLPPPPLKSFY